MATRRATKRQPPPETDDLDIPEFLLVKNRKPVQASAPVVEKPTEASSPPPLSADPRVLALTPECQEWVLERLRKHAFHLHWLESTDCVRYYEAQAAERKAKREEALARAKAAREERPTKRSLYEGLVSLRTILKQMGEDAPRKLHAETAIEQAKLAHRKHHFEPDEVERVVKIIREYVPPAGGKREHPRDAVIRWLKQRNPKPEGSAAWKRWDTVERHSGKTVGEFLKAGGKGISLRNAIAGSYAVVEEPRAKAEALVPVAPEPEPVKTKAKPKRRKKR